MMCPGLMGFDGIRHIVQDDYLGLPVLSHPAFLGSFIQSPVQGIAPNVLFGELPRALGIDVSVFPLFDSIYHMNDEEWRKTTDACICAWGPYRPIFPTVAGRLDESRLRELRGRLSEDCVYVIGGELQRARDDIVGTCRRIVRWFRDTTAPES